MPGAAEVSWAQLPTDHMAFVGRVLPASVDHRLRRTRLRVEERPHVLRKAAGLVERHVVAGTLLCIAPRRWWRSLLPLGAVCALAYRPSRFCSSRRGDAAAYAPGNSLPGQVGPAPADAGSYTAASGRLFSYGLLPPPP